MIKKRNYLFDLSFDKEEAIGYSKGCITNMAEGEYSIEMKAVTIPYNEYFLSFNQDSRFNEIDNDYKAACSFYGTETYISSGDASITSGKSDFTAGLWFRLDSESVEILDSNNSESLYIGGIHWMYGDDKFELKLAKYIKSDQSICCSFDINDKEELMYAYRYADRKWHHVFVSHSSEDNNMEMYFDFHSAQSSYLNLDDNLSISDIKVGQYSSTVQGTFYYNIDDPFFCLESMNTTEKNKLLNIRKKPVDRRFIALFPDYENYRYNSSDFSNHILI